MEIGIIQKITEFSFDNKRFEISKFKNYDASSKFRKETFPIIAANLRPIEMVFSAIINEMAPFQDWGLANSITASEMDIEVCLVPAFRVMLDYYGPDRRYTPDEIKALVIDSDWIYEVVYSQMSVDGVLDSYVRRKITFINDLRLMAGLQIDTDDLSRRIQDLLKKKKDPDSEFKI